MAERVHQYGSGPSDRNSFDHAADNGVSPYDWRRTAQQDTDRFAPLLLSDDHGEPSPDEYITPLRKKRASLSSRILAAVCVAAAVAVMFALFSSDAMRDLVNVKASMANSAPALPVTSLSGPAPQAAPAAMDAAGLPAPQTIVPGSRNIATASVTPTREELKSAYQSALQGRAPVAAPVEEPAPPADATHRLDPNEIAASLKRADALIASGDIAAARLVLRRAADDGDARAAIALAGTYDPSILGKLGVHGIVPDIAMARGWYEKARKFGAAEASQRLEVLAVPRR